MIPSLQIQAIELHAVTDAGDFSFKRRLRSGLMVVRADNAAGKSTCVNSIIYGLGLERMFGPSRAVPLTASMTNELNWDGEELDVLESWVALEIRNGSNEVITVKRFVKSLTVDTKAVLVWEGAELTQPGRATAEHSYFVRDPGAATRERGFHHRLIDFVGWKLPEVQRYQGPPCILYPEVIFPLFFVEQQQGWSGLQAMTPSYFSIREVKQRAVEFVLRLDSFNRSERAQELAERSRAIQGEWSDLKRFCEGLASEIDGSIEGLPSKPIVAWTKNERPRLVFVSPIGERASASELIGNLNSDLEHLSPEKTYRPRSVDSKELEDKEDALSVFDLLFREKDQAFHRAQSEARALGSRVENLREELRRNQDVKKLQGFGATHGLAISSSHCPTCQSSLPDNLLASPKDQTILMDIDQSIKFVKSQLTTFEKMHEQAEARAKLERSRRRSVRSHIEHARAEIRALKATLVSDDRLPSEALMFERIRKQDYLRRLTATASKIDDELLHFDDLARQWSDVLSEQRKLAKATAHAEDTAKLSRLRELLVAQLRDYSYQSFEPERIEIDKHTYRPVREGFDLSFDISASDNIRLIWAYLLALLELGHEYESNHLGLLIFDEPRQQEANPDSFTTFLQRAASVYRPDRETQILIATSQDASTLRTMLEGYQFDLIEVEGKLLQPS